MKKPNLIVFFGIVFLLGMAALLVSSYLLAHSATPFDPQLFDHRFGGYVLYVIAALIPAGVVILPLHFSSGQPSIGVVLIALAQFAVLFGAVSLVHAWLRRFSPALAFFGVALTYMLTCYGTNLLWLPAFSIAEQLLE